MTNQMGTIIITGAGKGLGRAIAHLAWQRGYSVALLARTESDLVSLQGELETISEPKSSQARPAQVATSHVVDLSNPSQVGAAFVEITRAHPLISALVNNAGTWTGGKKVQDCTPEDFEHSLSLNFMSAVYLSLEVLKNHRLTKQEHLCLVNVGATASVTSGPWAAPFGAAKAALRAFSQSLAREVAKEGIHVAHVVIDGLINNPRTRALNPTYPEARFMKCESIAKSIFNVIEEDPSCWTFEWDIRPNLAEW